MTQQLTIALTKGRILKQTLPLLQAAGLAPVENIESSRKLIIEAPKASPAHLYIAAASLNGKALNKAWIQHHEISDGARITFELSTTPTTWGRDTQPPSPITSGN